MIHVPLDSPLLRHLLDIYLGIFLVWKQANSSELLTLPQLLIRFHMSIEHPAGTLLDMDKDETMQRF